MKNSIQIFEHEEFGKVRTVQIDGATWFVGKDLAEALGYANVSKAVAAHVDDEDRITKMIPTAQNGKLVSRTYLINESGLYSLVLSSKLPTAKAFKRWVTSEILPSIRANGAYINDDILEKMRESDEFAKSLVDRLTTEKARSRLLAEYAIHAAPKVRYHDIILQCPGAVLASTIAKDYGMGCAKFNKLLHALGVQFRYKTNRTWLLYAAHENKGYTITNTHYRNGVVHIHMCWTQRGRFFLYEHLKAHGILPTAEQPEFAKPPAV